jgi:hypothetical protein
MMSRLLCDGHVLLWYLWIQVSAALIITSTSNSGGGARIDSPVMLEWENAVGCVNASLFKKGQIVDSRSTYHEFLVNYVVYTDSYSAGDVRSPYTWRTSKALAEGQYYFQLKDDSRDPPRNSAYFTVTGRSSPRIVCTLLRGDSSV